MYTTLHALYSGCSALSLRLFAISQSVPKWGKDLGTRTETNLIHQEKDGTVNTFSNPIVSVLCPECQGTCVNIEGDELEKTPASHSEVWFLSLVHAIVMFFMFFLCTLPMMSANYRTFSPVK
jgi:hypothetical protein